MNLIEQVHQEYYPELGHKWDEATQVVDRDTGRILRRKFSFLEWKDDYRVSFVNRPPDPAPYYKSGESRARAYFLITRTAINRVYEGGEELEIDGEAVEAAAGFKQWKRTTAVFDYERIWLDREVEFATWQPKPQILTPGGTFSPNPDPSYQLLVGEEVIREADEDEIVIGIPDGFWGVSSDRDRGVYLINSPNDRSTAIPIRGNTYLINRPYLRIIKDKDLKPTYRISFRGEISPYLPGNFLLREYEKPKLLSFATKVPKRARFIPPGVSIDYSFEAIASTNPIFVTKRERAEISAINA